jgi:hypothetical protein
VLLAALLFLAPVDLLERALAADHPDGLAAEARRLGATPIAEIMEHPPRPASLRAAILAAPHTPDAWSLVPQLVELAGRRDRTVAAPAARAAAAIATKLARCVTCDGVREEDGAELARAEGVCLLLAGDFARWADVRIHALECALALADFRGDETGAAALALLGDHDPAVRRAAVDLSPAGAPLGPLATKDADSDVAAAATARLCEEDAAAARTLLGERLATLTASTSDPGLRALLSKCAAR